MVDRNKNRTFWVVHSPRTTGFGERLRRRSAWPAITWVWLAGMVAMLAGCTAQTGNPTTPAATTPHTVSSATTPMRSPTAAASPTHFNRTATARPTKRAPTRAEPTQAPTIPAGYVPAPAGPVTVPVLLYHHINDSIKTRYSVSTATFRAQMRALHEQGYQTITISQLADVIRSGGVLPEKPVVLTFDDGYMDVYENAFPVLKEYGFTGTAYIITQTLEPKYSYGYMQARELRALHAAGWEIGSHSVSHTDLKKTPLGIGTEITRSRKTLEEVIDAPVRSFSYPYGVANDWIKDHVKEHGYESAVGLDILVTHRPQRLYYLSRREVVRSLTLKEFQALLVASQEEAAALRLTQTPVPPQR